MKNIKKLRETVKWSSLFLIILLSALHIYGDKRIWAPLDAYCPFGGLATLSKLFTQGSFLEKLQPSNLVLLGALIVVTLVFGGIFCGWLCPLGTLQDVLNKLRSRLKLPVLKVPTTADRYLRGLRYLLLGLILLKSFSLLKLWFADFDPFRLIFGLHWISEPSEFSIWGWVIMVGFVLLGLLIERFWCKYLCPLGLIIHWLSKLSFFKLRWQREACIDCGQCTKKCQMGLNVPDVKLTTAACNNCLECKTNCPKPEALVYRAPFGSDSRLALTGVAVFVMILLIAQVAGWWNGKLNNDPDSIKCWMSFELLEETYKIPFEEVKKELQLPAFVKKTTRLDDLEKKIPDFETDIIRDYFAKKLGVARTKTEAKEIENEGKEEQTVNGSAANEASAVRDPETIKGTMTLTEISEGWGIPVVDLLKEMRLPAEIPLQIPIRELENDYEINGQKARAAVRAILKLE